MKSSPRDMRMLHTGLLLLLLFAFTLVAACGDDDDDDVEQHEEGSAETVSLEGVTWVVTSDIETGPSATFRDGTVTGDGGCNHFAAGYTLDGESLELGTITSTLMACPPPGDEVESAFLASLEQVRGWRLDGDELVLLDADDDELLRFRPASLMGSWEVRSVHTGTELAPRIPGTTITATFAEDGTLSGSGGCNTYNATYTSDGGQIAITQPVSTLAVCPEPEGLMDQEAAYLAALTSATSFRMDFGLLLVRDDGTIVATFIP